MKSILKATCVLGGLCTYFAAATWADADSPAKKIAAARPNTISDVRLLPDGSMHGRVVDAQGAPLAGRSVTLSSDASTPTISTTDSRGVFILHDVVGGPHVLSSGDYSQHLRAWTHDSAPPSAGAVAKLVCGPTVRGQFGSSIGGFSMPSIHPARYLNHPLSIGGVIGCAIAAPLIIHEPTPEVPASLVYSPSLSFLPQYTPVNPPPDPDPPAPDPDPPAE